MTLVQRKEHPILSALDRIVERLPSAHSEHVEPDRMVVETAVLEAERQFDPSSDIGMLESSIKRAEELEAEIDLLRAERDRVIQERETARNEVTHAGVRLDNALTLVDTITTKFGDRIKLIRACLDSEALTTETAKLEAIRIAIDSDK